MATPTQSKGLGTLVVVVLKARNLRDKHTFTKQDPFVTVQLGSAKANTDIDKRGGQHPVWDADLHVLVPTSPGKGNRTLKVSCFAKEPRSDDLIGAGDVDITETLQTGEFDDWVSLQEDGAYRGEVYIEMTFFPSSTNRPLARRPSKMPSAERLHRPQQTPPSYSNPSSTNSSPRTRPNDLLQTPATLSAGRPQAGNNLRPPARDTLVPHANQVPAKALPVPSVLRPGNAKSSPIPLPQSSNPPGGVMSTPLHSRQEQESAVRFPEPQMDAPLPFPGEVRANSNFNSASGRPTPGPSSFPASHPTNNSAAPPRTNPMFTSSSSSSSSSHATPLLTNAYEEYERAALTRASQEEADAELARVLARNDGIDIERMRREEAERERADAELARRMQQDGGSDLQDRKRLEDEDHEIARKLARELNAGVLEESGRRDTTNVEGGRGRGAGMPGAW